MTWPAIIIAIVATFIVAPAVLGAIIHEGARS